MSTVIYNYSDALEESLNHLKSLKLRRYYEDNVSNSCAGILIDSEHLDSARYFNPNPLDYITRIFEDTFDSRFCLWVIHKYKEVTYFTKKLCVYDLDVIQPEDLINYYSLVKNSAREYRDLLI